MLVNVLKNTRKLKVWTTKRGRPTLDVACNLVFNNMGFIVLKKVKSYCPTLYLVSVLTKLCNIEITNPVQYKTYNN